ncbi:SPOR domain-containing protein [Helicobacter sp. UBA3407]|uniref:SPOR domain-containing protein n=1 Tax=Helicobacter sp. UBA3407 TaxID=1946588 RepID=UPI0026318CEF|nr:SPOR domain-containing protein [Helicobacter sp. UBA3407]
MTELESHKDTARDLELDDLLISNNEGDELKSGSNKKLILLSAIGVLLFAVIVLAVYLFQGDSQEINKQEIETQKPLERLEPKMSQTSNENQQNQNTDFGQVPIQNTSSDDQFQMIINQIKAQQNQNNASTQALPTAPNSAPKVESQKPIPQPTQMTSKPEIKQEPSKTTPKESFKDVKVNNPSLQGSEAGKGFYVQVGSFSKFSPNKQLLGLINESKLSYRMQKSGDNNRLLIGPYTTKQEAQNKLSEIRAKINKDAFIKEIK